MGSYTETYNTYLGGKAKEIGYGVLERRRTIQHRNFNENR
jgi:hypothetical protein